MENLIIPLLSGAVGTIFAAYSGFLLMRIKSLEKENQSLEDENKSYVALFVLLNADDEESLRKVRKKAAQILKGAGGVELD